MALRGGIVCLAGPNALYNGTSVLSLDSAIVSAGAPGNFGGPMPTPCVSAPSCVALGTCPSGVAAIGAGANAAAQGYALLPIVISVQRGKHTVTKVEGIPSKFCLSKLLKKLKTKDELSCNGHIAKDKESGREFLVLQGSFSAAVAAFLTREGLADADCIVHRG